MLDTVFNQKDNEIMLSCDWFGHFGPASGLVLHLTVCLCCHGDAGEVEVTSAERMDMETWVYSPGRRDERRCFWLRERESVNADWLITDTVVGMTNNNCSRLYSQHFRWHRSDHVTSHLQRPLWHQCEPCVEVQLAGRRSQTTRGRELTKTEWHHQHKKVFYGVFSCLLFTEAQW